MTKEELLADLRNRLTPIKNYFAIQQELNRLKLEPESFMKGYKKSQFEGILEDERLLVNTSLPIIEYIIKNLEEK